VLLGALAAAGTAKADDWQDCISNAPDQVLAPCSAVIEQGARGSADLSRAYLRRAETYRLRSRLDEALADFAQAEKLDPNSYNAIVAHGGMLLQKGQFAEALGYFERAIASNPKNPQGYFMRGLVRRRQNQLTEGDSRFRSGHRPQRRQRELLRKPGRGVQSDRRSGSCDIGPRSRRVPQSRFV
jgi:tetratricopeptide (TPR) repeat protein